MQKPSRLILWTLGGAAILFVVFVLGVNLYVQSEGMRKKLQTHLSAALGLPVKVFRASFTPWGGFHLRRVECFSQTGQNETFLTTDDLHVHPEWLPLLGGDLVISELILEKPHLTLRQDQSDAWSWPHQRPSSAKVPPPVASAAGPTPATSATSPTPVPSIAPALPPTPAPALARERERERERERPIFRKLLLKEGSLQLIDRQGGELLHLENIRLSVENGATPRKFRGKLQVQRILLRQQWEIDGFSSPAAWEDGEWQLSRMEGEWAEGRLSGSLSLDTRASDLPFALNVRLAKLFLPALCAADSDLREQLGGQLSGELKLSGLAGRSRRNEGSASLKITSGEFKQYPLLQTIGSILRNDELASIQLRKAETRLTIRDSALQITNLELASQNLRLTATGGLQPDLGLDLRCHLYLNEPTFKRLPSEARENFVAVPASKERSLDFQVYGRVDQPGTDLLKRLVGSRLQRKLRDVLGFFGQPFTAKPDPAPAPALAPPPGGSPEP